MKETETLQNFITAYMCLRKKQTAYFSFKTPNNLKECKILEQRLDELAQRIMVDYDMQFNLPPVIQNLF